MNIQTKVAIACVLGLIFANLVLEASLRREHFLLALRDSFYQAEAVILTCFVWFLVS